MFPNYEKYNKLPKPSRGLRITKTDKVLQQEQIPHDFYEPDERVTRY